MVSNISKLFTSKKDIYIKFCNLFFSANRFYMMIKHPKSLEKIVKYKLEINTVIISITRNLKNSLRIFR